MRLLLWPVALVVFLAWSLLAWLLFVFSDSAAALVAGLATGILSADLGPWATSLLAGLGNILQVLVIVMWLVVGILILATPVLLRRRRAASKVPDDSWRRGRRDIVEMRDLAEGFAREFRDKTWKKRRKKWDDD